MIRAMALATLRRRYRRGEPLYRILDDTQTLKRAKKRDAVGTLYPQATGKYGRGHTILKACLYCRGVTLPWGNGRYVEKDQAPGLKVPFRKLTELAADAVRQANPPVGLPVTVLFDASYLCPSVVRAVSGRGWHYIGVAKSNRRFAVEVRSHRIGRYGPGVLRDGRADGVVERP